MARLITKDDVEKVDKEIQALQAELKSLQESMTTSEEDIDKSLEHRDKIKRDIKEKQAEVAKVEKELPFKKVAIVEAEETASGFEKAVAKSEDNEKKAKEALTALKQSKEDKTQEEKDRNDKFQTLQAELKKAESEGSEATKEEIDEIKNKIELEEAALKKLKEELEAIDIEGPKLEDAVDAATDAIEKAKEDLAQAQDDVSDKESEVKALEAFVAERTQMINDDQRFYADVSETVKETQAKLVAQRGKYDERKALLIELESGSVKIAFEAQEEAMKEAIEDGISRERINLVIKNDIDDAEVLAVDKDNQLVQQEIRKALGIEGDDEAAQQMNRIVSDVQDEKEYPKAIETYNVMRKSFFKADELFEIITAAAEKGEASVDVPEDKITGTMMVTLNNLGYQLTFTNKQKFGRGKSDKDLIVTISWEYASAGK